MLLNSCIAFYQKVDKMNDALKELLKTNPRLREALRQLGELNHDPDGYIFSKKMRDILLNSKFAKKDIREIWDDPEFLMLIMSCLENS